MLKKVISGGQTGVDQAGLDAAIRLGIPHGGWCPKGRRSETGRIPYKYKGLRETEVLSYPERTKLNVRDANATIVFAYDLRSSKGTALTVRLCKKLGRPWFDVLSELGMFNSNEDGYDYMAEQLSGFEIINVAGSRESGNPGIFEASRDRFVEIFRRLVLEKAND